MRRAGAGSAAAASRSPAAGAEVVAGIGLVAAVHRAAIAVELVGDLLAVAGFVAAARARAAVAGRARGRGEGAGRGGHRHDLQIEALGSRFRGSDELERQVTCSSTM